MGHNLPAATQVLYHQCSHLVNELSTSSRIHCYEQEHHSIFNYNCATLGVAAYGRCQKNRVFVTSARISIETVNTIQYNKLYFTSDTDNCKH